MSVSPSTASGDWSRRPLRSWMFVPCNRPRFLEKIYEPGPQPDGVFLDLEDGVVPEAKQGARENAAAILREARPGPFRAVRVNAVGSEWFAADVDAVIGPGLEGLCIPKVESAEDLLPVVELLDRLDRDGLVRIIAAIESAAGLLRAPEIAAAHERMLAIMFGAEDYALDVGLSTKREGEAAELVHARSAIVVAATAARVISIDGVFPDLDDSVGLLADIRRARRLGFRAKSTFNPRQVDLINEHFSPTEDELRYARRVVDAFTSAVQRGDAAVAVGGQLVDLPIVRRAEGLLELAEQLAARPEGAAPWAGRGEPAPLEGG